MLHSILSQLPKPKQSILYSGTRQILSRLIPKVSQQKSIPQQKKQLYLRTFKQIEWNLSKVQPFWPQQIQSKVDALKNNLMAFESQLIQLSKGSSLFCGSSGNPKQLEKLHKVIMMYEMVFYVVGVYQNKELKEKEKIVQAVLEKVQKNNVSKYSKRQQQPVSIKKQQQSSSNKLMCQYCELMLSVSLCPNGYIAKKLVKELTDTEWIAGILYQQGTVVDKNLDKAILYYQQAKKKKNAQAIYRLGSLNQRGLYGKQNQYIQMWQQASKLGHLEALTDMGYLYQNGLTDEETNKEILSANQEKALKYYMKASEKNFPRALNNLATFYFNSKNYNNPKKCLQYLQKAADAEYVKSLHNLALIYIQGTMVNPDETKGTNLLKRAAQKGDIQARILYVQRILNDPQKSSDDDFVQINKYCRQLIAKDQEIPQPYYFLGIISQNGYGIPMQPKIAHLYYSVAASFRSEAALLKLGDCYRNGFGVEQDTKQAIRCYQQVAKTNPIALVSLGQFLCYYMIIFREIYEQGAQDLKVNYERAFQYYYEACNHNIPQAFNHMGNMYRTGRHVNKNDNKAQEYFEKAKNLDKKLSGNSKMNASSSQLIQSSYYRRR